MPEPLFPFEFVRSQAARTPDAPAISDAREIWNFTRLVAEVDAMASALQALTGETRPRVAVCGNNTIEHAVTALAVHASGGIIIPINARNSAAEVGAQIDRVEPSIMFTEAKTAHLFDTCTQPKIAGKPFDGADRNARDLRAEFAGRKPVWPGVTPEDVNGIKFTGGTSGTPKAVEQSFRCVTTLIQTMVEGFGFDAGDRHLCVAPISHGAGTLMVPILSKGGMNYLVETPTPEHVLSLLEDGTGTTTFVPPTLIYAIIDAAKGRQPGFPELRHVIYGAAPMPPEKVAEARAFFRGKLEAVYGQTEMPVVMSILTADEMADDANLASAGRITPHCDVRIMDPQGRIVGPNVPGEIVGRGPLMMNGYYMMPEETANAIFDGWLHTGDVGYLDERGYLFIKDRLRDVIISGGFNVYPIEVEDALVQHPAVRECVVFGVPDDKWGERVEAALELVEGAEADQVQIIAFAKDLIGAVKVPKRIHVLQDLPRSPVGKVVREEARALAMQQPEAAA